MRHRWHELTDWQTAVQVAASLHEYDGYPRSSLMPTPKQDVCLSPTPLCVDSGWALDMGGWSCTAPYSFVPFDYSQPSPCPARVPDRRPSLASQTSGPDRGRGEPPDFETVEVMRWMRAVLAALASRGGDVGDYALDLLCDNDQSTDLATVEGLGRKIVEWYASTGRAYSLRRGNFDPDTAMHYRRDYADEDRGSDHE